MTVNVQSVFLKIANWYAAAPMPRIMEHYQSGRQEDLPFIELSNFSETRETAAPAECMKPPVLTGGAVSLVE